MKLLLRLLLFTVGLNLSGAVLAQDVKDRFFLAFHSSTYLDLVRSPLFEESIKVGTSVDQKPIYKDVPVQSFNLNIFSIGLEPRYNLREFDDNSALAISAPFSIGLGQSGPANNDVLGVSGIGSFQLPLLAKLYIGSGSTYRSEKDYGISIGGGLEVNRIGLLQMDAGSEDQAKNRAWVIPVATLGVHFWRGYNPMEINLKYGAGNVKNYYVDKFGTPLSDNGSVAEGAAKSTSFRLSISYLLNY